LPLLPITGTREKLAKNINKKTKINTGFTDYFYACLARTIRSDVFFARLNFEAFLHPDKETTRGINTVLRKQRQQGEKGRFTKPVKRFPRNGLILSLKWTKTKGTLFIR